VRVLAAWILSFVLGRDIVTLEQTQHPRDAFAGAGQGRRDEPRVGEPR